MRKWRIEEMCIRDSYNPLIDEEVRRTWNLPEHWHLIAEMPFGLPIGKPGEKRCV